MGQLEIITHYIIMQLNKWLDINIGAFASLLSAFFGRNVILFIDPRVAQDAATIAAALVSFSLALITGYIGVKKAKKEMAIMKKDLKAKAREDEQDEVAHVLFVVHELEVKGLIDADLSVEEKIEVAKNISQKIRNR